VVNRFFSEIAGKEKISFIRRLKQNGMDDVEGEMLKLINCIQKHVILKAHFLSSQYYQQLPCCE